MDEPVSGMIGGEPLTVTASESYRNRNGFSNCIPFDVDDATGETEGTIPSMIKALFSTKLLLVLLEKLVSTRMRLPGVKIVPLLWRHRSSII